MKNIWQDLPRPIMVLAPMEAVTDVVFRHVVKSAATPDLYMTEFTNATGWMHAGDKAIGGRLVRTDDEHPIIAQLWGSDPVAMEKLAIHCKALGYDGIDINMGCPDMSAVKAGGGAGMIRTPELAAEMIASAKRSGLPVSVKTRLGYSTTDEWCAWLTFLLEQDIAMLTIHLRTKKEMSKTDAHWELMTDIRKLRDSVAPQTLLIGNGDVRDRQHAIELANQTGIDGVMIGRGIFHNPFAFELEPHPHDRHELLSLLRHHLDLYDTYHELTGRPFDTLKRFFKIYVRDFEGSAQLRDQLMHTHTTHEVRQIIDDLIAE
jgi:tRNA-dihydrouridine synthase